LFGKNPHLNITQCEIRADRYVGDSMVEWLDRKDIHGTLFEIIKLTEEFMLKNMRTPAKVIGFKTEFRTEYPVEALREAIINALVHRDWHNSNAILLRMFNSHIDILSPGELLRPLKIEEIKRDDYVPLSRNKIIIEVLGKLGIMDKRGSGILRMREAMKEWKLPEPRFEENTGYFVIKFTGPYQETVIGYEEKLNERQKIVLNYLSKHKKIKREEYAKMFKCSTKTAFNDLNDLVKKGVLNRMGKTGRYTYYTLKFNVQ